MACNRLSPNPALPEWRRSGHFFVAAVVLHAAVLAYPLGHSRPTPPPPIMARLIESVAPPAPAKAQPAPEQPTPVRHRERPQPTPRPVLAMNAEQAVAPPAFSVPAPAPTTPAAPAPSPAPAAPAPVAVSPARFDPAYLQTIEKKYPMLSRRLGEEGKVLLKVLVGKDGQPATVEIEKSSNFERLDEAARQAVARWRFTPAKRGDEAIEASVIVPIVFRLEG